jgi:hypothetical protein
MAQHPTDPADWLAGLDVPRIRVEGATCDALAALDTVSQRADALELERSHAVGQAVHGARLSLVEALRRCGRDGGQDHCAGYAPDPGEGEQ